MSPPPGAERFDGLYQWADLALYKAKKNGKHGFFIRCSEELPGEGEGFLRFIPGGRRCRSRCRALCIALYRATENSIRGLVITIINSLGTGRTSGTTQGCPPGGKYEFDSERPAP